MQKLFRFFISGLLVYGINIGSTYIFQEYFLLSLAISYALALFLTTCVNFTMSLFFTFKTSYKKTVLYRYLFSLFAFSILNYVLTLLGKTIFGDPYVYIIIFIVTSLLFGLKFIIYDKFVFVK